MNLQNRKGLRSREQTGLPGGKMGREGEGVWDGHVHTAVFKTDNQQGPTVPHRELYSILYNRLMVIRGEGWGKGQLGSLGCTHTHCYI